jgi:hypothetical protein
MRNDPLGYNDYWRNKVDWRISVYTENLLLKIVGDTGQNEGGDDLVARISQFYLDHKPQEYQNKVGYSV